MFEVDFIICNDFLYSSVFIHIQFLLKDRVYSPCKEDAAVHDGSSNYGHSIAFILDAILSHTGVTYGHVHALVHHWHREQHGILTFIISFGENYLFGSSISLFLENNWWQLVLHSKVKPAEYTADSEYDGIYCIKIYWFWKRCKVNIKQQPTETLINIQDQPHL